MTFDAGDKRYYTRYQVRFDGWVAHEKGFNFPVEILDISIEGARLKSETYIPIKKGDIIYLLIKWKMKIKVRGGVKWIKEDRFFIEFGVQFKNIDMQTREAISGLISEHALTSLLDTYSR